MAVIISESIDTHFNLATEEFLLRRNLEEDIFFVWKSQKAFVFGRNQNPFLEVSPEYFHKDIPIIRRISGGGTIYQDMNTINFSYLTSDYHNRINDYEYFLKPIILALQELGIDAIFKPKSNIFVNNKKISGNAQAFINKKLLHHGTILFNTDLRIIEEALIKNKNSLAGNYIFSNKQEVVNISDFLDPQVIIDDVIEKIIAFVIKLRDIKPAKITFSEEEVKDISLLAENKYKTWDWNFGKTSKFETIIDDAKQSTKILVDKGIVTFVEDARFQKLLGTRFYTKEYSLILKEIINKNCT